MIFIHFVLVGIELYFIEFIEDTILVKYLKSSHLLRVLVYQIVTFREEKKQTHYDSFKVRMYLM